MAKLAQESGWSVLDVEEVKGHFDMFSSDGKVGLGSLAFEQLLKDIFKKGKPPDIEAVRGFIQRVLSGNRSKRGSHRASVRRSIHRRTSKERGAIRQASKSSVEDSGTQQYESESSTRSRESENESGTPRSGSGSSPRRTGSGSGTRRTGSKSRVSKSSTGSSRCSGKPFAPKFVKARNTVVLQEVVDIYLTYSEFYFALTRWLHASPREERRRCDLNRFAFLWHSSDQDAHHALARQSMDSDEDLEKLCEREEEEEMGSGSDDDDEEEEEEEQEFGESEEDPEAHDSEVEVAEAAKADHGREDSAGNAERIEDAQRALARQSMGSNFRAPPKRADTMPLRGNFARRPSFPDARLFTK
jgi:hypothetical protein